MGATVHAAPVNGARGEVRAVLGGRPRRLCLTLGALAALETGLGVQGAAALAERLSAPSGSDLILIVSALLDGAGEATDGVETFDPMHAIAACVAAFHAAVAD